MLFCLVQSYTTFKSGRAKNGAIVIQGESRQGNDPFDLPANQMKRIVMGILWRDEHFAGAMLKDIAHRDGRG